MVIIEVMVDIVFASAEGANEGYKFSQSVWHFGVESVEGVGSENGPICEEGNDDKEYDEETDHCDCWFYVKLFIDLYRLEIYQELKQHFRNFK